MQKINVVGSIFGTSGYDSHTRSLINALAKVADVKLITQLPPNWNMNVNDKELEMITKPLRETDTNIIITTPHNWKLYLGPGKNIGYCVWEGDKVPLSYIEEFLNPKIDLIFVPSIHTESAIANTCNGDNVDIIMNKVRVIPHGVDISIFKSTEKPKDKFRFICNKGWRGTSWDRGGVQYVLKAYAEEFKSNENVELIVKLNPSYINPEVLNQSLPLLNLPVDRASININLENIPFNKLLELYNMGNVFVCATRAESFNLPGLEAMSCGLPTIQTSFGGQVDYMTKENSLYIDYILEYIKEDMMYDSTQWATPIISDLRKQMRWAFEHQKEIKKMGEQALEDSKNWTWDKSAEKIIKCFEDINQKGG